jgi:hypothetical protein
MPSDRHPHSTGGRAAPPRASYVLALQRWAGNRAVAGRFGWGGVVQRESKPATLAEAIEGNDPDALLPFRPFPPLSPGQLHKICRLVMDKNSWVGPDNELTLESAWRAVAGQRAALTDADWKLWQECEGRGADVKLVPWMREMRTSFADRVRAKALRAVENNVTSIRNEAKRLGIAVDGSPPPAPTRQSDEAVRQQRELARQIEDANGKLKQLRTIPVGYGARSWGTAGNKEALPPGGVPDEIEQKPIATFDPAEPPVGRSDPDPNPAAGIAKYEVVKAVHDDLIRAVAEILNDNPALYAITARGGTAAILREDVASTRNQMASALQDVLAKAAETKTNIETRALSFTALQPAIGAVYAEPQYSAGFTRKLAEDYLAEELEAEGDAEALVNLLTIALITAVEVGSGGTATPVVAAMIGLAASAGMAAASWDEWAKLETAAKSTVSDKDAIVTQEQADTAQLGALISTAAALLDVYAAGKAFKTASAGSQAAAKALEDRVSDAVKLKQIAQGAAVDNAREVVERAVASLGPATTVRRVGSWQKLTATLGTGSQAMGKLSAWRDGVFRAAEEAGMTAAARKEGEAVRAALALASGIEQAALGEALDAVIEVFSGDGASEDMGRISARGTQMDINLNAVANLAASKHQVSRSVQRSPIEIVTLPISELRLAAMSGDEFENLIRQSVASGYFRSVGLPRMTVIEGKVHGGGHGFDGLGIAKQGPLIKLYNLECKYVGPESGHMPSLPPTAAGMQGSLTWKAANAKKILSGANPYADETLEEIARAVRKRVGSFDERILEETLVDAVKRAEPYVFTTVWAKADLLVDHVRKIKGVMVRVAARRR